jgi:hypothetical protein
MKYATNKSENFELYNSRPIIGLIYRYIITYILCIVFRTVFNFSMSFLREIRKTQL